MKIGIKETQKNFIVDVDEYTKRERYYQGTSAGVVLRFSKEKFPKLLGSWNEYYETELDMLLAMGVDDENGLVSGVTYQRRGHIVQ